MSVLIEALKPLRVKLPSGEVRHLRPGQRSEFTREDGERLLERAAGKVRIVEDSITVGMVVTWDSPLFGLLSATVQEALPSGVVVVHPLTDVECTIPVSWVCKEPR